MIQLNDKWTGIKPFNKWPSTTISLCQFLLLWFHFNSISVPLWKKILIRWHTRRQWNNLFPCYKIERRRLESFECFKIKNFSFYVLYERNHSQIFKHISHNKINKNFNKYLYGLNIWTFFLSFFFFGLRSVVSYCRETDFFFLAGNIK